MSKQNYLRALLVACGLLLVWGGSLPAAEEPAKVAGTWDMTIQGRQRSFQVTLTLLQDGSTIKGSTKGERGESPLEGTVTGNRLNFTVKRDTPNGPFTIEYTGTLEGDSLKGTFHSERFDGEWSAKRAAESGAK